MTPSQVQPHRAAAEGLVTRSLREVGGVVMILVGSLMLVGLVFINNDSSALSQRLLFGLGLPGMGLVSVLAQFLVFGGLAILWAVLKRRP